MPRSLGARLPPALLPLIDGRNIDTHEGLTFLLITTAEDGWPHVAMLSVGELVAPDDAEIRLALWPGTQSTKNLGERGQGLLMLVWAGAAYYVRLRSTRLADASVKGKPRARFNAQVVEVLQDVVDYAVITSGIDFQLRDRTEVLPAWRESVDVMRTASE